MVAAFNGGAVEIAGLIKNQSGRGGSPTMLRVTEPKDNALSPTSARGRQFEYGATTISADGSGHTTVGGCAVKISRLVENQVRQGQGSVAATGEVKQHGFLPVAIFGRKFEDGAAPGAASNGMIVAAVPGGAIQIA